MTMRQVTAGAVLLISTLLSLPVPAQPAAPGSAAVLENEAGKAPPQAVHVAPTASTPSQDRCALKNDPISRQKCIEKRFRHIGSSNTKSFDTGAAGQELLMIVAQVVVDRATKSAWGLLRDQLELIARCKEPSSSFKNTCFLISKARFQELISSPNMLLDGIISDILGISLDLITAELKLSPNVDLAEGTDDRIILAKILIDTLKTSAGNWKYSAKNVTASAKQAVQKTIIAMAKNTQCPASGTIVKSIWLAGQCVIDGNRDVNGADALRGCITTPRQFTELLTKCSTDQDTQDAIRESINLMNSIINDTDDAKVNALLELIRMTKDKILTHEKQSAALSAKSLSTLLEGIELLLISITQKNPDWLKAGIGFSMILESVAADDEIRKKYDRLTKIVAGIAQYSSVSGSATPEQLLKTRKDILESFLRSMSSRSEREAGTVVSLGGAFGLGFAYRYNADRQDFLGPFVLPIGIGLQTYHAGRKYGFHFQTSILDIGQYISWSGQDLQINKPGIEEALSFGVNAGVWFGSREIPIFVGPQFGVSPFVRSDNNRVPSVHVGLVLAAYVPFIDFN